jgi:hypothetical protein
VCVLAQQRFDAGEHDARWTGRGEDGRELHSGVYFLEMRAGGRRLVKRFVWLE